MEMRSFETRVTLIDKLEEDVVTKIKEVKLVRADQDELATAKLRASKRKDDGSICVLIRGNNVPGSK